MKNYKIGKFNAFCNADRMTVYDAMEIKRYQHYLTGDNNDVIDGIIQNAAENDEGCDLGNAETLGELACFDAVNENWITIAVAKENATIDTAENWTHESTDVYFMVFPDAISAARHLVNEYIVREDVLPSTDDVDFAVKQTANMLSGLDYDTQVDGADMDTDLFTCFNNAEDLEAEAEEERRFRGMR